MSKALSLEQLKELAKPIFDANPEEEKVFATTDGNIFPSSGKNHAELHSKSNKGLTIYEIERPGTKEKKEEGKTGPDPDAVPTEKNNVETIKGYMTKQEIAFEEGDTKKILIGKIEAHLTDLAEKAKSEGSVQ